MLKKRSLFGGTNAAEDPKGDVMLRNKLKEDADNALLAHNQELVDILRYLISLIDKKALQLPPDKFNEAEEIGVLQKELKNKEEAKKMFENAGRTDLVEKENREIEVLKMYLPQGLGEAEIEAMIDQVMGEGAADFGSIMRGTLAKAAGRAGGQQVSELVKKKLGQ
jgi:uncharacterized protein YqeY